MDPICRKSDFKHSILIDKLAKSNQNMSLPVGLRIWVLRLLLGFVGLHVYQIPRVSQMCSKATIEMYISMTKYMNLGVDCKMYMQVTTTFAFLV